MLIDEKRQKRRCSITTDQKKRDTQCSEAQTHVSRSLKLREKCRCLSSFDGLGLADTVSRTEKLRWLYLRQTILFEQSHSRLWRALIAACIFVSIEVSHHISTSAGLKVIASNVRGVMPPFVAFIDPADDKLLLSGTELPNTVKQLKG